jgi:hypothetical protein
MGGNMITRVKDVIGKIFKVADLYLLIFQNSDDDLDILSSIIQLDFLGDVNTKQKKPAYEYAGCI